MRELFATNPGVYDVDLAPTRYPKPSEVCTSLEVPMHQLIKAHAAFVAAAQTIAVKDIAVPYIAGKEVPVKTLDQASIVPIVLRSDSLSNVCPQRTAYNYAEPGTAEVGRQDSLLYQLCVALDVYVDGHMGILLMKEGIPIAIASGSLTADGPLVQQIQGLRFRYEDGTPTLRLLDWRCTAAMALIALWHRSLPDTTPHMCGKPILLQSAMNNRWASEVSEHGTERGFCVPDPELRHRSIKRGLGEDGFRRFVTTYDGTATRLGANSTDLYGNYILPTQFNIPNA